MKQPKAHLDPHTARCLRELRATISQIETGEVVLRRFADVLTEQDGLHREISISLTWLSSAVQA